MIFNSCKSAVEKFTEYITFIMKKSFTAILILFTLMQSVTGQNVLFSGHFLYQNPLSRIFSVSAGDLDNDNNPDIIFTEPDHNLLQWFHNENNGQFSLQEVGAFPAIEGIAADLDGDLDMDVIACSYDLNQVVWFENDGNQAFTMHLISDSAQHPLTIAAGDVDNDGDQDIVCATQDAGTGMVLLVNDGNMNFTLVQLSMDSHSSTWAAIADLDQDNDLDILGNNFMANGGLLWYEQTAPMVFTEHLIPFPWAHGGAVGDIDGDGDIDLAGAACGTSISWFENDGNNSFTKHTLSSGFSCPVSVVISDINKDGHNDIVSEAWGSNRIHWWENDGNQVFAIHLICDTLVQPSGLCVSDLNNDSLPDVIAGSYSKKLDWFENEGEENGIRGQVEHLPVSVQRDRVTGDIIIHLGPQIKTLSEIQIIDTVGRICYSTSSGNTTIVIRDSHFGPGIYLIRVLSSGKQYTEKIYID